jgi:hypothetical protein
MSVTHQLACVDCREKIWIGQSGYLYGTDHHTKALGEFLHHHRGHNLRFDTDDYWFHRQNYTEWEVTEADS